MPKVFNRVARQTLARTRQKMNVTLRSKIGTQILILAKSFQSGRVPEFGTNVPKNERSVTSRSQIGTQILILAKTFQEGRVPNFGTNVPKNERGVKKAETPPKVKRE